MAETAAIAPNFLNRLKQVNYRRVGGVALVATLLAGCSSGYEERGNRPNTITHASPSASPEVEVATGDLISLDPHREVTNTPSGLDCDADDIPELPEGVVLVDGRCDAQNPDTPVGIHVEPTQQSEGVATAPTGAVLEVADEPCKVAGERIANSDAFATNAWVEVQLDNRQLHYNAEPMPESAFVPGVWVHGEENLPECR